MLFFCSVRDYIGAKMSKLPGPSRIPTFGTRIIQPGSTLRASEDIEVPPISPADVGRRVLAAGKVGILRFVGEVHFASDVWCGIELEVDVGKNDGSVEGVRYFTCSPGRGLMTPLSKVTIVNESNRMVKSDSTRSISSLPRYETFDATDLLSSNDTTLEGAGTEKKDETYEIRQERIQLKTPNVLRRGNTFDQGRKDDESSRLSVYDRNDNRLKRSESYVNNNIAKKRGSIITSSEDTFFSYQGGTIDSPQSSSTPSASTARFDKRNFEIFNTRCELYRDTSKNNVSYQMTNVFRTNEKTNESDERINSTIKENPSYRPNQTLESDTTVRQNIDTKETPEHQNVRTFIFSSQEEENKRDSLDFDESLEILTVSQMNDGFSNAESAFVLDDMSEQKNPFASALPISNFELMLQENVTLISDTTINLELTLDTTDKSKNFHFTRIEETPSPEELPLDPIPIVGIEPKAESTKSKSNSFITSITSITSLDTGYQGDGEMSRPGSRGADNSPLTRRPLPRPPRRTDAMTDSDFFTESDADNHDENVLKGDRKAQIIDGTLYGVDPQAAADIYVNNRENMDSSGIFTDIESNTRAEELLIDEKIDISPSDTSTKTLSENSQSNVQEIIAKNVASNEAKKKDTITENAKKRATPSPAISNTSSTVSPRHLPRDDCAKKYKTLKREVQSKVKAHLDNNNTSKQEKKILKKPAGRWDAVMNKISKSDSKTNFQEVKSRVFNGVGSNVSSPNDVKKSNSRQANNQKTPNNKLRRPRTRVLGLPPKITNGESIHSSLSDLSTSLPKKTIGSIKKKDVQVTQVLTAAKLSPKLPQQTIATDAKRRPVSVTETKTVRKGIFSVKEKKSTVNKENARNTVKGGRTSPVTRSPTLSRVAAKPAPKTVEALAILVQHLVFNVQAFEVPNLKSKIKRIEEQLIQEKQKYAILLEEERNKWQEEIAQLIGSHQIQLSQIARESEEKLTNKYERSKADLRRYYEEKLHTFKKEFEKLQQSHAESLDILREENEAIREDIDEKNEEIRSAKHESSRIKEDYEAKEKLLKEQINLMSRENMRFKQELAACKEDVSKLEEERTRIAEENKRLISYGEGKGIGVQEVESLRVVLELKQSEVSDLRKSLAEANHKAEVLSGCEEKASLLQARCEDLQLQLQRKNDFEMTLQSEKKRLEQILQEEAKQKRNISLRNEELQWKLEHNKEVITKILEQTNEEIGNKSEQYLSSSFNSDKYSSNTSLNLSFKNFYPIGRSSTSSEFGKNPKKSINSIDDDESPPHSPRVKGVVEKSDSVSYVLDLDESPEVVASRLVRRSFRNSLNQKNTPTKSPGLKKPRNKGNPLSQSSSASSLISSTIEYQNRSRSVSSRNGDNEFSDFNYSDNSSSPSPYHCSNQMDTSHDNRKSDDVDLDFLDDHTMDLTLPALPSELGDKTGVQPLPRPKHLAGESLISESNSEDECTSSSSGPL